MLEALKKAKETLENRSSGWASRREAAELLGKVAQIAVECLYRYRYDDDIDVRNTVEKACSALDNLFFSRCASEITGSENTSKKLEILIDACQKPGVLDVRKEGELYLFDVLLESGRRQKVHVEKVGSDTRPYIRIISYCLPYNTDMSASWMLRANSHFAQAAVAIVQRNAEEWVAVLNTFIFSEVTAREMKAAIREVAFYADWLVKKLSRKGTGKNE